MSLFSSTETAGFFYCENSAALIWEVMLCESE